MRIAGAVLVVLALVTCPIGACVAFGSAFASKGTTVMPATRLRWDEPLTKRSLRAQSGTVLNTEVWIDVPIDPSIDDTKLPRSALPRSGATVQVEVVDASGRVVATAEGALEPDTPSAHPYRPVDDRTRRVLRISWKAPVTPAPPSPFAMRFMLGRGDTAASRPPPAHAQVYAVGGDEGLGLFLALTGVPTAAGILGIVLLVVGQVRARRRAR